MSKGKNLQTVFEKPKFFSKIALTFIEEIDGNSVLDVGAGEGTMSYWMQKSGKKVSACDIRPELFVLKNIECRKVDLNSKIPYKSDTFDIVLAEEVYEHLYNHRTFLDEIHRILKKGGYFILTTPNIHTWYSRLKFLFVRRLVLFEEKFYSPLGHVNPLILNIFESDIKKKFIIEKMYFSRAFIPILNVPLPIKNLLTGDTFIFKLRKI